MSSKTKIVVLRMKEIIYTAIFIGLGIILVTLLFIMFRPEKEPQPVLTLIFSALGWSFGSAESMSWLPLIWEICSTVRLICFLRRCSRREEAFEIWGRWSGKIWYGAVYRR